MKQRLDLLLLARGLSDSREKAQRLIMAGEVFVNGQRVDKPGMPVDEAAEVDVRGRPPYVSRGGLKLAAALDQFQIDVRQKVCMDVGASTGGFSDVLLQRGAAKVYAIDVGYGQLDWKIRSNPRVVVMERTNIRQVETLPEPIQFASIDVSFISLRLVLPVVQSVTDVVALIKPQFEAGRGQVGKGGVVRDANVHRTVLTGMLEFCSKSGWSVRGIMASPIKGPAGNVEFPVHLRPADESRRSEAFERHRLIDDALAQASDLR